MKPTLTGVLPSGGEGTIRTYDTECLYVSSGRIKACSDRDEVRDAWLFRPALYQLSYFP